MSKHVKLCAALTLVNVYSTACVKMGEGIAATAAIFINANGIEPGRSQSPSIRVAQSLLDFGGLYNAYLLICA